VSKIQERRRKRRSPVPVGMRRVSEVAALTSTSPSTIYSWVRQGRVKAKHHRDLLYVSVAEVRHHRKQRRKGSVTIPPLPPAGLHTVRYVSAATGISKTTLQRWARAGLIEARRHGARIWYISLKDARELSQTLKPGPKPK
jgi:predicted site-specific integrase-resolvase